MKARVKMIYYFDLRGILGLHLNLVFMELNFLNVPTESTLSMALPISQRIGHLSSEIHYGGPTTEIILSRFRKKISSLTKQDYFQWRFESQVYIRIANSV